MKGTCDIPMPACFRYGRELFVTWGYVQSEAGYEFNCIEMNGEITIEEAELLVTEHVDANEINTVLLALREVYERRDI
jgi:adenine-specific DNA methylase